MKSRIYIASVSLLLAVASAGQLTLAQAQRVLPAPAAQAAARPVAVCGELASPLAVVQAMHLLCANPASGAPEFVRKAIIVCFLGGFVKPDDTKHPEIWFARYLRDRYGPDVRVWVFANSEEKKAIHDTMRFIELDNDKYRIAQRPAIIVYGHSWGGSQGLTFARDLERKNIPVLLTIQIDSVRKLGQDGHTVPANVFKAVNFYQTRGLTPGETHIVPENPAKTTIVGNFRMQYDHVRISCDNYKWLSRIFNKPHHQIENDPRIWDAIARLIDTELTRNRH